MRDWGISVLLLAAWAAPMTANAASRFDLVCSGQETQGGVSKADSRRYTIDLPAKRWCRTAECGEALDIEKVTADEITFIRSSPDAYLEHRHFISRTKGTYTEHVGMAGGPSRATGTCKTAPFSGFPKAKF